MSVETDTLFDLKTPIYSSERECNLISTWATLALNTYRNTNNCENANGRHLFVTSVSRVFETMRLRIINWYPVLNRGETITPLAELLLHMADALRWSLVRSQPNCGAYISLPWVKDILQCYQAAREQGYTDPLGEIPMTENPTLRPTFLFILRLLQTCLKRGLLTGQTTRKDFMQLLELLNRPKLPGLPKDIDVQRLAQDVMRNQRVCVPAFLNPCLY